MNGVKPEWLAHQQRRFMRPDALRYWRPDAYRYFKPGFALRWRVERKAGFNPEQPRDENGRWEDTGRDPDGNDDPIELPEIIVVADDQGDVGPASDNEPKDTPPEIPQHRPPTPREVNDFLKTAARWIARNIDKLPQVRAFVAAYAVLSWLDTDRRLIEAYNDPPKTLEELQQGAGESKFGYHIHHIVEQTQAENEGYPRELIDGRQNLVRIPALKHWEITGWYMTRSEQFGGLSPRKYLQNRDWDEKMRIGLDALRRFEVLTK